MSRKSWWDYFDSHHIEATEQGEFSIYSRGLEPDKDQTVIIFHHGAGYSALSFATLTKELFALQDNIAVVSIDCRAHGKSSGNETDVSINMLINDFVGIVNCVTRQWTAPHSIFLVGHSLGGSVITRVANRKSIRDVIGIIVIDIVEEAALKALINMPSILSTRPKSFSSVEEAIQWSLTHKICRNLESAAISIPDQLSRDIDGSYSWRVDLMESQEHWECWFRGLSNEFIRCDVSKLLVLAEREYLDRSLMIESMQGKFQCSIIRDTGHAIQEDKPDELAKLIISFIDRNLLMARLNQKRLQLHR